MNEFRLAVDILFKLEGGYCNDSRDPGGETKYGISKKSFPSVDIPNLTIEKAKDIYLVRYWSAMKCEELPWMIALYLFDMGVNCGNVTAIKTLQACLGTTQDGIIGPRTIGLCSHLDPIEFLTRRVFFYQNLKQFPIYGRGWINRLFNLQSYAITIPV